MKKTLAILLFCVLSLSALGVLMLYSATVSDAVPRRFYFHLIWLVLGFLLGFAAAFSDYEKLSVGCSSLILLGLAWLMLGAVLVPGIGASVNGARRWFPFGGQPSEFAKIALVLALAVYGAKNQSRMSDWKIGFLPPMSAAAVTAGLIFVEQDWGTAILVAMIATAMILIAGARWLHVLAACAAGVLLLTARVLHDPLRLARLSSFMDPEQHLAQGGWQGWHSILSIGTGGLFGSFFGEGSHKYGFVPEQQTDFIFALIGEELGFIGTTSVVLLFASIILCGMRIVWRTSDSFGQLLASGLTLLIGIQAVINIGVCTSSLPNKGIPLPFVSYGGSSMLSMMLAVGLLASIARRAPLAPVYPRLKGTAPSLNPFGAFRRQPTAAARRSLPNLLPPSQQTVWRRSINWLTKIRGLSASQSQLLSYQKPPRHLPSRNPLG